GTDVKLHHLGLTRDQVRFWQLPGDPTKISDRSSAAFRAAYGDLATEIDALEALRPGELNTLVRTAAAPYRDLELARQRAKARAEAQQQVDEAWTVATAKQQGEIEAISDEMRAITDRYRERLEQIDTE